MQTKNLIPPADLQQEEAAQAFADFVQIVHRLRLECPWDREQTHESIRHLLIEETYEAVDAVDRSDWDELKKELGDLMLHLVFHSVMAKEEQHFTLKDVLISISEKLILRHPHVYGDVQVGGAGEVLQNWEKIKQKERGRKKGILSGVPKALPALLQAERIQDKAAGVGFDFPNAGQAWAKVEEELHEFKDIPEDNTHEAEAELGDVFFALINYARLRGISPEMALKRTNDKFIRRFNFIEARLEEKGTTFDAMSLDALDAIWEEAKSMERAPL